MKTEGLKWLLGALVVAWAVVAGAQRLTLAWDASSCGCAAGYRLYYGTNTRSYPFVTDAGRALTQSVVLPHGGRWFFAVTAYDTNGLESEFSSEVTWEDRPVAPVMRGEPWVRVAPVFEQSTNQVTWQTVTGAPTWFPATNAAETFRLRELVIERVIVP
jgi:hypothetical protein